MRLFITHHPPSGLKALEVAQTLIAEYEKRNKWLESENLRLIGLAYPLTGSPTTEETPMLTIDEHSRIIELSDAANRATCAGNHGLAEKLTAEAEKLIGAGRTFEEWIAPRNYNLERYEGEFVSKITKELHDCWVAAGGVPVK